MMMVIMMRRIETIKMILIVTPEIMMRVKGNDNDNHSNDGND